MIKSYHDIEVYQESYRLTVMMHKKMNQIMNRRTYELVQQIKRASMSIPLNIAEGYGKRESTKEFKRFLRMSVGSVNEMEVLIQLLKDLEHIETEEYQAMIQQYKTVGKRLNTMIKNWV